MDDVITVLLQYRTMENLAKLGIGAKQVKTEEASVILALRVTLNISP